MELLQRVSPDMSVLTVKIAEPKGDDRLQLVSANDNYKLESVRLTPEHPVYVINRNGLPLGWVRAAELTSGDEIADIDGGLNVKVVSNQLTSVSQTVYNFEVTGNHNYFADEIGLWVHNAKKRDIRQFEFAMREIEKRLGRKCNKKDRRRVHDEITKEDLDIDEIIDIGEDLLR